MELTRNRKIVIGAVVALGVAGGGAAIAANQLDSPSTRSAAIVADAAQQLGVQPDALTSALKKAEEDQIDKEVAAGQLTKAQGEAQKAAIESGQTPLIAGGGGGGFGGPGGGPGLGGPGRFGPAAPGELAAAATYLGVSVASVQSDLSTGMKLSAIAVADGKTADGLIGALVDSVKTQLDAAVKDGRLTTDEQKHAEDELTQRITDLVNGTNGGGHFGGRPSVGGVGGAGGAGGFRGGLGGGGGFGRRGGGNDAAATYLGVTAAALATDLQGGKTLADVAKATPGKTVDGLVAAMVAASTTRLDAAVKAGYMTADQEKQFVAGLEQRTTDLVNGKRPTGGFGGPGGFRGGPGGFGGGGGLGGGGNPGQTTTVPAAGNAA